MPIEEQTQHNYEYDLRSGAIIRLGQRLTISNRQVTKLGFWLWKYGAPPGNVYCTIRKVSDDSVIVNEVLIAANSLTGSPVYREHTFSSPPLVDEEVRILVEYNQGNVSNSIFARFQLTDVKADEYETHYDGSYTDNTPYDCAYRYTYEEPVVGGGGGLTDLVAAGII